MESDQEQQKALTQEIQDFHREILRLGGSMPFNEENFVSSRLLMQMIPVGVLVQSPQGEIFWSNETAAQLLGVAPEQLMGRFIGDDSWDVLHEDGTPFLPESHPVRQVLQKGCPVKEVVMGVQRPDRDERVWLLVNAEPIVDHANAIACVVCTFTDISERLCADKARNDSEERYRVLFENSPLPTWVYDRETLQFLAVNEAAITQYGYERDEFLAMTIRIILPEEEVLSFLNYLHPEYPEANGAALWKHLRRDKSLLDARVTSQTIRFNGREARLIIAENVTDYRQADREIRKLKKRIINILESIRDGFVTLDKQWQFAYLNSRAEQIFHARRDSLQGKNFWDTFPELQQSPLYRELHRAATKQNPVELEHYFAEWDVWLRINVHPSQDGLSIYMADITDRKRVEEKLHQTIGSLKRSVDGIVRAMSFAVELRDPYTAGHQRRVSLLVCAMARQIGMSAEEIERFRVAALLHDIGKIAMPAEILSKPGQLSRPEMSIIQGHAQLGYDILKGIDIAPQIALVALQHHERLDGSGYPNALSADEIIPEAKMMAVADVVEAMASHRPFRPSLGIEKALNEVLRNKGVLYDVAAVDACLAVFAQNGFDFEQLMRTEQGDRPESLA